MPGSIKHQSRKNYLQHVLTPGKSSDYKKANEVLRNEMAKLKEELDIEKTRSKQSHREKILEFKKIRDEVELTNKIHLEEESIKLNVAKDNEIRKIKENFQKEKEQQIRQIIKFKDEEIRTLKKSLKEEKDFAIREALDSISLEFKEKLNSQNKNSKSVEKKLRNDIDELQKAKELLEKTSGEHSFCLNDKTNALKELKREHDIEIQKLLREARRENSKSLTELQKARKELNLKENEVKKLQQQNFNSEPSITRNSISLTNLHQADDVFLENSKNVENLISENKRLRDKLSKAKNVITDLEIREKKKTDEKDEGKEFTELMRKNKELKRRNNELVLIAKKLEEKARHTEKKYNELKTTSFDKEVSSITNNNISHKEDFTKLKSSFAIQRAKDKAEHAQVVIMKENQLKQVDSKCKEMESLLSVAEKERLRLEKQLSCSPNLNEYESVQIELQKTLKEREEQDKELEDIKQVHGSCEEQIKELLSKVSKMNELKTQLKSKEEECVALSKELTKNSMNTSRLEKQLIEEEATCKNLRQQNKENETRNEELEKSMDDLKAKLLQVEKLKIEKSELDMQLIEANDKYERMADKVNDLQREIHELKKNLLGEQSKTMKLDEQLEKVQQKLIERDEEIIALRKLEEEASRSKEMTINSLIDNLRDVEENCATLSHENLFLKEKLENQSIRQPSTHVSTQTRLCNTVNQSTQSRKPEHVSKKSQTVIESAFKEVQVQCIIDSYPKATQTESDEPSTDTENILNYASMKIDDLAADSTLDDDLTLSTSETQSYSEHRQLRKRNSTSSFKILEAKHSYDPEIFSPTSFFEAELSFVKGERLCAFKNADKTGYYLAEKKNGERGLVSTHRVKIIDDGDLSDEDEYHSDGEHFTDVNNQPSNRIPETKRNHSNNTERSNKRNYDEYEASRQRHYAEYNKHFNDHIDLDDTSLPRLEQVDEIVPHPTDLKIEHKLNTSLVLTWKMPSLIDPDGIKGYAIFCDDKLRQTVLGASRSKALISDIYDGEVHVFNVSTVTLDGIMSDREKCMMISGKESALAPFSVTVSDVTSSSVRVTWKQPDNTLFHSIYLNGNFVDTLQPGVHMYNLIDLTPNSRYHLTVQGKQSLDADKNPADCASVDLYTTELLPPEAPLHFDVRRVNEKHLEFTWIPVTIKQPGYSNGSRVTGYTIYMADDVIISKVGDPLQDNLTIPIEYLRSQTSNHQMSFHIRTNSSTQTSTPSNIVEFDIHASPRVENDNIHSFNRVDSIDKVLPAQETDMSFQGSVTAHEPLFVPIVYQSNFLSESYGSMEQPKVSPDQPKVPLDQLRTDTNSSIPQNHKTSLNDSEFSIQLDQPKDKATDKASEQAMARVFNPENEYDVMDDADRIVISNSELSDRIIVSDGELSIIEELSEEESSARHLNLSLNRSKVMQNEPLTESFSEFIKPSPVSDSLIQESEEKSSIEYPTRVDLDVESVVDHVIAGNENHAENSSLSENPQSGNIGSRNETNTLSLAKPCIFESQKLLASDSVNISPLISERYLSGPTGYAIKASGSHDDTLAKIESVAKETNDDQLDNTISNEQLSETMLDFYSKEDISTSEIFLNNKTTEGDENSHDSELPNNLNSPNKMGKNSTDFSNPPVLTEPRVLTEPHVKHDNVLPLSSKQNNFLSDEGTLSLNALSDTDNSYPITDSFESMNDSIETFRYHPSVRKKEAKLSLPSSIEEEVPYQQNSENRNINIQDEDRNVLRKPVELSEEVYKRIDHNIDENHNKTDSINFEEIAREKTECFKQPVNKDTRIFDHSEHVQMNIVTTSTTQLPSAEIIDMVERDAQRDILDDCPELPLDTSNDTKTSHRQIVESDRQEFDSKVNYEENADEKSLSSVDSEEDSLSLSYQKAQKRIQGYQTLDTDKKNNVNDKHSIRPTSLPNSDSLDEDSIETSEVSSVIVTSELSSVVVTSDLSSSIQVSSIAVSNNSSANPTSIHFSESDQSEIEALLNFDKNTTHELFKLTKPTDSQEFVENVNINKGSVRSSINSDLKVSTEDYKPLETKISKNQTETGLPKLNPSSSNEITSSANENIEIDNGKKSDHTPISPLVDENLKDSLPSDSLPNDILANENIVSPVSSPHSDSSVNREVLYKSSENLYTLGASFDLSDDGEDVSNNDDKDRSGQEDFDFSLTPLSMANISKLTIDKQTLENVQPENSNQNIENNEGVSEVVLENTPDNAIQPWVAFANETVESTQSDSISDVSRVEESIRIFIAMYSYDPLTQSPNVEYADDELAFPGGALIRVYGEIDEDGFYFGEYEGKTGFIPGNMVKEIDVSDIDHALSLKDVSSENEIIGAEANQSEHFTDKNENSVRGDEQPVRKGENPNVSGVLDEDVYDKKFENISNSPILDHNASFSKSMSNLNESIPENPSYSLNKKTLSMPDMGYGWNEKKKDPYRLPGQRMVALFDYDPVVNSPNVDSEIELAFRAGDFIDVYGNMDEDGFYAGKARGKKGLVPSNFIRVATAEDTSYAKGTAEESPKLKKKNSILRKSKKIFSRLTGHK